MYLCEAWEVSHGPSKSTGPACGKCWRGRHCPAGCLYVTITERNFRSRGQTFHGVTGALTALWPVSDEELRDWWVLLAAAGAKFHSGQRGLLRCVSFPRSGCRADVNSRQNWAIFLKQCHCPLALRQYDLSVSPSRVSSRKFRGKFRGQTELPL
jgi:hypothetical protein